MKKRNFKQLGLNKKTISTFKQEEVKGGITPTTIWFFTKLLCEEEKKEDNQEGQS